MAPREAFERSRVGLRATGITKRYGETVALWGVDLEARSGAVTAVRGPNGSGKSTLLRIIAGITMPTRGRVTWTADTPGGRPRIAFVGHATHLFDDLTVRENVALAARLARRDISTVGELLRTLGIEREADRRARAVSVGTRRRVALARAIAAGPDALVLDEPFASLDDSAADLVELALAECREAGRLVLLATHEDALRRSLATTTLWLGDGRVAVGSDRRAAVPA